MLGKKAKKSNIQPLQSTSILYTLTMKKKTQPLDFNNVCNIRTFLSLAIKGEIREYKESRKDWGVTSHFAKSRRQRIGEMINAYRAAKNIEVQW